MLDTFPPKKIPAVPEFAIILHVILTSLMGMDRSLEASISEVSIRFAGSNTRSFALIDDDWTTGRDLVGRFQPALIPKQL